MDGLCEVMQNSGANVTLGFSLTNEAIPFGMKCSLVGRCLR